MTITLQRWQPVPFGMCVCCISEKARVVAFSLLCPISDSQVIIYLKVKQQQTKELLTLFYINGNYLLVTRGSGLLGLFVWKVKMVLGPTGVLMASTQAFFSYCKGEKNIWLEILSRLISFSGPCSQHGGPQMCLELTDSLELPSKKRFNKAQSLFCQAWLLFLFKPTCTWRRI